MSISMFAYWDKATLPFEKQSCTSYERARFASSPQIGNAASPIGKRRVPTNNGQPEEFFDECICLHFKQHNCSQSESYNYSM